MSPAFSESVVEDAALAWLQDLGYTVLSGPVIAAGEPQAERRDPNYRDVVLEGRLRQALAALNPDLPPEALEDAYRKLMRADAPSLIERDMPNTVTTSLDRTTKPMVLLGAILSEIPLLDLDKVAVAKSLRIIQHRDDGRRDAEHRRGRRIGPRPRGVLGKALQENVVGTVELGRFGNGDRLCAKGKSFDVERV